MQPLLVVSQPMSGTGKAKRKSPSEWVWTEKLFDGIVSQATFEAAQARLKPHTVRAPTNPDLWLSGIVFCAMCGGRMSGWHAKDRDPKLSYRCDTYVRLGKDNPTGCWPHLVSHDILLHWIDRYLADTSQVLGHRSRRDRTAYWVASGRSIGTWLAPCRRRGRGLPLPGPGRDTTARETT